MVGVILSISLHCQGNVYQPIPPVTSQPHSDIPVFAFAEFTTENESSAATNVEFPYISIDSAPKILGQGLVMLSHATYQPTQVPETLCLLVVLRIPWV